MRLRHYMTASSKSRPKIIYRHVIPILFLHGWGTDSTSFASIRRFFESNYQCVFVDFDCNPKVEMMLDDYAEYVKKTLAEKNITKVNIIAHSFGARVAVLLAKRNPNLVNRMVLTGAAGLKPRFNIVTWLKIRLYKTFKIGHGSTDYRNLCPAGKKTFQNIIKCDLSLEIKNLAVSTLLVWGRKDKTTPIYMAKRWTRLQTGVILKTYPEAGHYAFVDAPARFIYDVQKFFEV